MARKTWNMSHNEYFVKKQRFPNDFELQSRKCPTSATQSSSTFKEDDNNLAGKELKQRLDRFKTSGKFHVLGRFINDCNVDAKNDPSGGTLNMAFEVNRTYGEELEESEDDEGAESFNMDSSFSESEEKRPKLYEEESDELVL